VKINFSKKNSIILQSLLLVFVISVNLAYSNSFEDPNFKSNTLSTRTDAWILDLQANYDDPQWFYDNLNTSDRKKIRLALDYAIPREDIINSILDGHGSLLATTIVPQTGVYYDSTIVPRVVNLTKSVELLTAVFGYTFVDGNDNISTPYDESFPYFRLTMNVPRSDPLRAQWAARIAYNYNKIGIDNVYKEPSLINPLIEIINSSAYENNYDNGGFDTIFIGWSGGTFPGNRFFFHSDSLAPNGGNYQGINDPTIDALIEAQESEKNVTKRIELYKQGQQMFFDDVWRSVLFQSVDIFAFDTNLVGFNPYFGASIQYQNLTFTTGNEQNSFVASRPGEFSDFNPFISNSWYDNYVLGTLNYGLMTLSTPPGDLTYANYQLYTFFADWWNQSDDELTFFFNLKEGLQFEDGSVLNASDVVFSYDAMLNGAFPGTSVYNSLMTNSSSGGIIVHNETLIEFTLSRWDPFSELTLFGLSILSKEQMEAIPLDNWATDSTNTGTDLIGNGPYTFESVTNQVAYLKNSTIWTPDYYNKFSEVPYIAQAIANGGFPVISNVTIVLVNQADVALTSLKTGQIDFIDSNTGLASVFNDITVGGQATYQTYVGTSWQEMGLNQGSPIWGLSPINHNQTNETSIVNESSLFVDLYPSQGLSNAQNLIIGSFLTLVAISTIYVIKFRKYSKSSTPRQSISNSVSLKTYIFNKMQNIFSKKTETKIHVEPLIEQIEEILNDNKK
jgi:ABC-type transport system substrate-binding protein